MNRSNKPDEQNELLAYEKKQTRAMTGGGGDAELKQLESSVMHADVKDA